MANQDPWPSDDPLGAALHQLRMRGAFYCRSELRAPWGLELESMPGYLWFHAVTAGTCRLETKANSPLEVREGDLALVPHGEGHALRSDPGVPLQSIEQLEDAREPIGERYEVLRFGGSGPRTEMICCAVAFDHPAAKNAIDLLPSLIHVKALAGSAHSEWMQSTLRLMSSEVRSRRAGGEAVVTRLADILVIQAVRSWIETDDARSGWIGALKDDQVGRALLAVQRDPAREWTVASLSTEAAMSRSAFAARFKEFLGEGPMSYVTRWRMHLASTWLETEDASVAELALRLGYGSEAAFSRAFKRSLGVSPGAVRRSARAAARSSSST